jgi:alpha-L-fucosidase 2
MRTLSLLVLFPSALAKSLFSLHPANSSDIIRTAYPIGNGKLGILPFGEAGNEKLNINRDSLWSGGPFENTSYRGGNPAGERFHSLPAIRDWIWQNGTGNVSKLMGDGESYGSYAVLANLSVVIDGVAATSYRRTLDLETGKHVVQYRSGEAAYKM